MTRVLARRTLSGLIPADDQAKAEFARVPAGKPVYVEIKAARNPKQHRLYWALCGLMADNSMFPSASAASTAIKYACGHVEPVMMPDGATVLREKSINYASMTQTEFAEFFETAVRIVAERWLPGVTSETLRKELEDMIGA